MKVSYISDLHLDFHAPFHKNQIKWQRRTRNFILNLIETDIDREVIVIAGDISHFNMQSIWALEVFSDYYEQVFLTDGNHDNYLISKSQSNKYNNNHHNRVFELIDLTSKMKNVKFLGSFIEYEFKGKTFAGSNFWYPLENTNQQMFFHNISNDSKLISGADHESIHEQHLFEMERYECLGWVDVIVTHVPPISINSHYKYNSTVCYLAPVKELKANRYIFGHCHEQSVYEKAGSKFYINAVGYPDEKLELSIKSFTI
ncbi:metallophosphoesterase [Lederbergia citrisecunda]|uniref:metallophosphoesterase family protein n=1 Tax=Lederbergia citrisecunda TaxID=2833583 RepID=UPI003D2683F2